MDPERARDSLELKDVCVEPGIKPLYANGGVGGRSYRFNRRVGSPKVSSLAVRSMTPFPWPNPRNL